LEGFLFMRILLTVSAFGAWRTVPSRRLMFAFGGLKWARAKSLGMSANDPKRILMVVILKETASSRAAGPFSRLCVLHSAHRVRLFAPRPTPHRVRPLRP